MNARTTTDFEKKMLHFLDSKGDKNMIAPESYLIDRFGIEEEDSRYICKIWRMNYDPYELVTLPQKVK